MCRWFLPLFFVSFAWADCPVGVSIGQMPGGTPDPVCVAFNGDSCWSTCHNPSTNLCAWVSLGGASPSATYYTTGNSCGSDSGSSSSSGSTASGGSSTGATSGASSTSGATGSYEFHGLPDDLGLAQLFNQSALNANQNHNDLTLINQNMVTAQNAETHVSLNTDTMINQLNAVQIAAQQGTAASQQLNITGQNILGAIYSNTASTSSAISTQTQSILTSLMPFLGSQLGSMSSYLGQTASNTANLGSISGTLGSISGTESSINSKLSALNSQLGSLLSIDGQMLGALESQQSGSGGSGSGSGSGSVSGPAVGSTDNPAHVAGATYKPCTDCLLDVSGAQAAVSAAEGDLTQLQSDMSDNLKTYFKFSGLVGPAAPLPSCWDLGPVVGNVCLDISDTWSLLKGIVFLIFALTAFYMMTRDNKKG